ncbi:MAG TPA: hypothetical protein VGM64_14580 [Lacunisphaera sp.]
MNQRDTTATVAADTKGTPSAAAGTAAINRESFLVVLIGSIVIYLMSANAFKTYFFGENFIYLQFYINHGRSFWQAFFSPFNGIFYRPLGFAFDLPWQLILPPEPLAFHLRNFGFILLELFLLHRILCRVATTSSARYLGCAFFILSKIHLTLIGYINSIDTHVLSLFLLLSALFFLRYVQGKKQSDYWFGLLFCLLSHFSKDYGLVVNAVVLAIIFVYDLPRQNWVRKARQWFWRILPLGLITTVYFCVRTSVLGGITQPGTLANTDYSPRFLFIDVLGKLLRFATTLCNASSIDDGSTGSSGLSTWFASWLQTPNVTSFTLVYCGICGLAFCVLFWKGRKAGAKLLFPSIWSAAYLAPTLLVKNVNVYYHWEPMMGVAVLLTLLMDAAGSKFSCAIGLPFLALIGISGYLSNESPSYHWAFISRRTAMVENAIVEPYRNAPLSGITFVAQANQLLFWRFSLADPMMQQLLHKPALEIRYSTYADVANRRVVADPTNLVLDAEHDFTPLVPGSKIAKELSGPLKPPSLISVAPNSTVAGRPFNMQPNGISAISVECNDASPQSILYWNSTPLQTAYGNSGWLTALVPKELYAVPGVCEISIGTNSPASNKVLFHVRP